MLITQLRKGIAMIELIFAIVIMGIVLMSAPMLVSQASNSGLVMVQQEAIAAASTNIGMILTRHWDEQDTNESMESPILVANGSSELNEATDADGNLTGRRAGTPVLSYRSFLTSLGGRLNASAVLGAESGDDDDIDDFNGQTITLGTPATADATTTEVGDYADTSLQLATAVSYINDGSGYNGSSMTFNSPFGSAAAGTTNIKAVSTTVTSGSHDAALGTNITLRAFSCNIGTYQLEERSF
jgi:hypothetical protein